MPGTASYKQPPSMPCAYPTTDIHRANIGSTRSTSPVRPGAHPASASPALAPVDAGDCSTLVAWELVYDVALPAGYKWVGYWGCDL
jgi:hypothetical protein